MPNPVLNENTLSKAPETWAPPAPPSDHFPPPMTDGPISPWKSKVMTVNGVVSATAVLFVILLASAAVGWSQTDGLTYDPVTGAPQYSFPALAWVGMIVGVGLTFLLMFKPHLAKFIAPIYAIAQGFFVGALSKAYETWYDGIVVQAAGATIAVFGTMLVLYRTRIIKVTNRMRRVVITATIGIMVFYGVCWLIQLFAGSDAVSFLGSSSLLGIAFSVFVAGLAAFNLMLDFDFIERGAESGDEHRERDAPASGRTPRSSRPRPGRRGRRTRSRRPSTARRRRIPVRSHRSAR